MRPEGFPEREPDTQRDLERPSFDSAPPGSTWKPRAPMGSATYSIVPGRDEYESGVACTETASVPPPRPESLDDSNAWRVDRMLARLMRLSHYELLEIDETAEAYAVTSRYHALVSEAHAWRASASPALRRKIDVLLDAFAEAYEALATTPKRAAYDAKLREARGRR
jgi:hypothetical protein